MPLEIYNTLTRKKEVFTPVHEGGSTIGAPVGMYVCGPTVYSDAHVGHAKSYITFDIVNRYLRFLGYRVTYVQNITDVGHLTDDADEGEDKLDVQSRKERKHPMAIAEYYTRRYYEDMAALNVQPPDIAPRATGHIIEQIELIKKLIERGCAYEVNGNVYFDVSKDEDYGKLSGRKSEDQEASGRVQTRSDKRNPQDFALWKRAEGGHILRWPSPWGEGFPGWHIECSAMSMKYLGETIDIHGGGLENQFPHHECEIAQSECVTHKQFVRYWMHNNMVTVGGKKMGKSLGNSSYLRDLIPQYGGLNIRFTILQSHYRGTTEFTTEAITAAATGYEKLRSAYRRATMAVGATALPTLDLDQPLVRDFIEAMNDDFNTPKAIAVLYELATETNNALSAADLEKLRQLVAVWKSLAGDVLGILPSSDQPELSNASDLTGDLMQLIIGWRKQARTEKNYAMGDAIRKQLEEAGVLLEDSKDGTTWRLK